VSETIRPALPGQAEKLLKDGYRNAAALRAGVEAWKNAGYPLVLSTGSLVEKETLKKRIPNIESSGGGQVLKQGILPVVSFCVERSILFVKKTSASPLRRKGCESQARFHPSTFGGL